MKKQYTFLTALVLSALSVSGQVVEQKQTALMAKKTATWCNPCGTWGWELFEEIYNARKDQAVVFENHFSSSSQLYVPVSGAMNSNFEPHNTTPVFYVNGNNETQYSSTGGIFTSSTKSRVLFVIDSIAAVSPVANSGSLVAMPGGASVDVTTKTKFFQAATGEFYLGVYVTEHDVVKFQEGIGSSAVHHNPLRASVTAAMGDLIVNGPVTAGQEFTYTGSIPVNAAWNPANLRVFTVIWKKVGTKYEYVNASKVSGVVGIEEAENTSVSASLYPMPVVAGQAVTLTLSKDLTGPVTVTIQDGLGRTVQVNNEQISENSQLRINTSNNLSSGLYFVTVSSKAGYHETVKMLVQN